MGILLHVPRHQDSKVPVSYRLRCNHRCRRWTFKVGVIAFIITTTCVTTETHARKHGFHMRKGPLLVGPVGPPFGFLDSGYVNVSSNNFLINFWDEKLLEWNDSPYFGSHPQDILKVEAGLILERFSNEAAYHRYMLDLKDNHSACAFEYYRTESSSSMTDDALNGVDDAYADSGKILNARNGIYLPLYGPYVRFRGNDSRHNGLKEVQYQFQKDETGLFFLTFQVCPYRDEHGNGEKNYRPKLRASLDINFHFINYDSSGTLSYLTAGEMKLPSIFLFFSVSYFVLWIVWFFNIRSIQAGKPGWFVNSVHGARSHVSSSSSLPRVYMIHHLMTALVGIKFLSVFFESIRYHMVRVTGHAEVWSVLYYVINGVRGSFFFVMILLLGTGWSFVKPFLNPREKMSIAIVLTLQVINNLALTVLSQVMEGERRYQGWIALLHLVDILCCCVVVVPIVWSVNALQTTVEVEETVRDNDNLEESEGGIAEKEVSDAGEKEHVLKKLRLFRSFYLLVVAYIYATRIIVYLFASMLDYQHLWVRYFAVELATLTFYVTVGCLFKPMSDNPFLTIDWNENNDFDDQGVQLINSRAIST